MKVTLFIPVRNEIESIKQIMPKVNPEWVDEILFCDGHSTDGTPEWLEAQGYKVIRQKSMGIGGAYWEALPSATGDVVIAFSPDGNSIPEVIPQLVKKMKEGHDMVVASRYAGNAKSEDDDIVTRFGNWMFTKLVNVCFGARYTDTLVIFRAFKRDLPYRLGLRNDAMPIFEYELGIYCAKQKLSVAEIPADEPKRIGDVRKMRPLYNGSCLLYALGRALVTGKREPKPIHDVIPRSPARLRRVK